MTSRRPSARRSWWLSIAFVLGLQLALVPPARACSCAQPGPMADYRGDPASVIFTAIVEPRDARGFPATVTRWFQGGLPAPRIWFDARNFGGDGASCGIAPLPVLTEWIFVAYRIEGQQELGTGLCSPHAPLTGPDGGTGQAMLVDAIKIFGAATVTPGPTPNAVPTTQPGASIAPLFIAIVAILGVMAGAVVVWRSRRSV